MKNAIIARFFFAVSLLCSASARAANPEPNFESVIQDFGNVFFKKLVPKFSELSGNFILEQSDQLIRYFGNESTCSGHPNKRAAGPKEVLRNEIVQRIHQDHLFEEFTYFVCGSSTPLFRETLITYGQKLKLMDRTQILAFERRITLDGDETRREYSLDWRGAGGLPIFQLSCEKKGLSSACRVLSSGTPFISSEISTVGNSKTQEISVQLPLSFQIEGQQISYSGSYDGLRIEKTNSRNTWYYKAGQRVPLVTFQKQVDSSFMQLVTGTLGLVAQIATLGLPKTSSLSALSAGKFRSEFTSNYLRVQSGDMSGIKEFLQRMDKALQDGRLVIQENGY